MYILTKGEKYVAMDLPSGGYPYLTDNFMEVKVWHKREYAENYRKANNKEDEWELRKLYGLDFSLAIED